VTDQDPKLSSRLLIGAIAGFAGTMAMTAAMNRLHRRLPQEERYPLTPREIIDSTAAKAGVEAEGDAAKDITTAAHFAYGAAAGSLLAAANPRMGPATGAAAGVGVWLVSYMGWLPGVALLKPATRHPLRRNLLMIGVHLVWGAATAKGIRELSEARGSILRDGPDEDAVPPS
jgi:uncharacterized membrane protein YagU involved in acid resistance